MEFLKVFMLHVVIHFLTNELVHRIIYISMAKILKSVTEYNTKNEVFKTDKLHTCSSFNS